jgi:hypothetical protein
MEMENSGGEPKVSLKLLLPPEELELIRVKKELELKKARLKMQELQLKQLQLQTQLERYRIKSEIEIESLKELEKMSKTKLKEMSVSSLKVLGVVGKVVITPNLAVASGEEVGRGLVLEVTKRGIFVVDKKGGNRLVVATYTTKPEEIVRVVKQTLKESQEVGQTFQLRSGEKFRRR